MQVQQTLHNHPPITKPSIKMSPTTVRQFFQSEQYKLAVSGFSTPVISILINNPRLHQELLDSMLLLDRPQFNSTNEHSIESELAINLPFKVFDLFSNFEDVYPNYMFGYNGAVQLENNGRQLLLRMFSIFQSEESADQTAIGYLFRMVDEVLTRNDTVQFFRFLSTNPKILEGLTNHLECPAACNMIFKALEPGNEDISPQDKIEIVRKIVLKSIQNIKNKKQRNQSSLEGLKFFAEKILDRASIRKLGSSQIPQYLLSNEVSELICKVLDEQNHLIQTYQNCFEIIILYLKQFKQYETAQPKARGSTNKSSRLFLKALPKIKTNQLSHESIEVLVATMSKYLLPLIQHPIHLNKQKKNLNLLIMQVLELMALYVTKDLKSLLTSQLVVWMLQNMINLPYCNLYHVSVKQIVCAAIEDGQLFMNLATMQKFNFFEFIFTNFMKNTKLHCFESHIYEMIDRINKKVDSQKLQLLIRSASMTQQWKQLMVKYQQVQQNRIRKYQDAADEDINQQEIRQRARSIGAETILPILKKIELTYKVSATETLAQSSVSQQQIPQIVILISPPPDNSNVNNEDNAGKQFQVPIKNIFQVENQQEPQRQ